MQLFHSVLRKLDQMTVRIKDCEIRTGDSGATDRTNWTIFSGQAVVAILS